MFENLSSKQLSRAAQIKEQIERLQSELEELVAGGPSSSSSASSSNASSKGKGFISAAGLAKNQSGPKGPLGQIPERQRSHHQWHFRSGRKKWSDHEPCSQGQDPGCGQGALGQSQSRRSLFALITSPFCKARRLKLAGFSFIGNTADHQNRKAQTPKTAQHAPRATKCLWQSAPNPYSIELNQQQL